MKAVLNWDGGMAFSGMTESGHMVLMNAGSESGGLHWNGYRLCFKQNAFRD